MRIAAFKINGRRILGEEKDGELIEFLSTLALGDVLTSSASSVLSDQAHSGVRHSLADLEGNRLCPASPSKIFGIGMNYTDFVEEAHAAGIQLPPNPVWFSRPPEGLLGPEGEIWLPPACEDLALEAELVIVIGRTCYQASREQAALAIGGYTAGNDITLVARAQQSNVFGKSHPRHASVGPVVVTADEIPDPHRLTIGTRLNGEVRQDSSTDRMIMDCAALVAKLSEVTILSPGDLIFTGTPAGTGVLSVPPRFLRAGDVIEVEIGGIGVLRNRVVNMPVALATA